MNHCDVSGATLPPEPLCERTVRICAEQARRVYPGTYAGGYGSAFNQGVAAASASIEALLPKPDPVKLAVSEYRRQSKGIHYECLEDFGNFLIHKGWKAP